MIAESQGPAQGPQAQQGQNGIRLLPQSTGGEWTELCEWSFSKAVNERYFVLNDLCVKPN